MNGSRVITKKSAADFEKMKIAGMCVAAMHAAVREAAGPGVTTRDLDGVAREVLAEHGCRSSFLGYGGPANPFPGVICTSPNSVIVHGIPGDYVLRDGDIVSIDAGAIYEGWHGDAAFTVAIGDVPIKEAYDRVMLPWLGGQIDQDLKSASFALTHDRDLFVFFDGYRPDLDWLGKTLEGGGASRHVFFVVHQPVVPYNARSNWHVFARAEHQVQRGRLLELLGAGLAWLAGQFCQLSVELSQLWIIDGG